MWETSCGADQGMHRCQGDIAQAMKRVLPTKLWSQPPLTLEVIRTLFFVSSEVDGLRKVHQDSICPCLIRMVLSSDPRAPWSRSSVSLDQRSFRGWRGPWRLLSMSTNICYSRRDNSGREGRLSVLLETMQVNKVLCS